VEKAAISQKGRDPPEIKTLFGPFGFDNDFRRSST